MKNLFNYKKLFDKYTLTILVLGVVLSSFYVYGNVKDISLNDLENSIKNNKLNILYVGRPTCPSCVEFQPKLEKVVKKNMLNINYFNTDKGKENDEEAYHDMIDKLEVEKVPSVIILEGDQVLKKYEGNIDIEEVNKELKNYRFKF